MDEAHDRLLAVVEDNDEDAEILLAIVNDTLRTRGVSGCEDSWNVVRYRDGEEFLCACGIPAKAQLPAETDGACEEAPSPTLPDLVFLDLNLPGLDGLAILLKFRAWAHTRAIPALVVTTSTNPRDVGAAYEAGANGYYRKPVDLEAFERLVDGIVALWTRDTVLPLPPRIRIRP